VTDPRESHSEGTGEELTPDLWPASALGLIAELRSITDRFERCLEEAQRLIDKGQSDDGAYLWQRCYACGHRLALPSSACPQCGEEFDGRNDPDAWPEGCECDRCREVRL